GSSTTGPGPARPGVRMAPPTRRAPPPAWNPAANTVAISTTAAAAAITPPAPAKGIASRIAHASAGHVHAHQGVRVVAMPSVVPWRAGLGKAWPRGSRRRLYNANRIGKNRRGLGLLRIAAIRVDPNSKTRRP